MEFWRKLDFTEAGNIIIALSLGVLIWFSATTAQDPNIAEPYPELIPLEIIGLNENMLITTTLPETVEVQLRAPQSVWATLNSQKDIISATIDLSNYKVGDYMMPIDIDIVINPVDVLVTSPPAVAISIENKLNLEMPITTDIIGEPALGYQITNLTFDTNIVQISGAEKNVSRIKSIIARINIFDKNESFKHEISLIAIDEKGARIEGITINPQKINAEVDLAQSGGYRDVAVILVTIGAPKEGYHVTNITSNPIIVTLYSPDPEDVQSLPGYVNTLPLDISGAETNIQTKIGLDLPENINVASSDNLGQTINVFIGITATEGSAVINIPIQAIGLNENYEVRISPESVDVIVSGPLSNLEELSQDDIHLYIDLTEMELGTFTTAPIPEIINESLKIESILPEMVEIELFERIPPTATPISLPTALPETETP